MTATADRKAALTTSYSEVSTERTTADSGVDYAYRTLGAGTRPLVLLQHFRGNLDNWDPALIDALARDRRVITFDNVGVGGTSGITPSTVDQMADGTLAFLDALGLDDVDLLGFSLGSFVAQEIALVRPSVVHRMVLASAAPKGAPGMHGWEASVIEAVGGRELNPAGVLGVFYTASAESRAAGLEAFQRMGTRSAGHDAPTTWQTRQAQYDAICRWGIPDPSVVSRVSHIRAPVLIANGDSDPMILPRYSDMLAALIPDAQLRIYPDAAHGFLFQHHERFATEVAAFLHA